MVRGGEVNGGAMVMRFKGSMHSTDVPKTFEVSVLFTSF